MRTELEDAQLIGKSYGYEKKSGQQYVFEIHPAVLLNLYMKTYDF